MDELYCIWRGVFIGGGPPPRAGWGRQQLGKAAPPPTSPLGLVAAVGGASTRRLASPTLIPLLYNCANSIELRYLIFSKFRVTKQCWVCLPTLSFLCSATQSWPAVYLLISLFPGCNTFSPSDRLPDTGNYLLLISVTFSV
jgi:hypothetical protein